MKRAMTTNNSVYNEVETNYLCMVSYRSRSNKGLLFCGIEVCLAFSHIS
jgi:hypothetical protein